MAGNSSISARVGEKWKNQRARAWKMQSKHTGSADMTQSGHEGPSAKHHLRGHFPTLFRVATTPLAITVVLHYYTITISSWKYNYYFVVSNFPPSRCITQYSHQFYIHQVEHVYPTLSNRLNKSTQFNSQPMEWLLLTAKHSIKDATRMEAMKLLWFLIDFNYHVIGNICMQLMKELMRSDGDDDDIMVISLETSLMAKLVPQY